MIDPAADSFLVMEAARLKTAILSDVIWRDNVTKIPKKLKNKPSGSYARLFGNTAQGNLMSRVHSGSIKAGNELERMITERVKAIEDLDDFLTNEIMPDGVLLATKKQIKKSTRLNATGLEPDFMIFKRREESQHCHVVELKDGYSFDTKKAEAEHTQLHNFVAKNARRLPYRTFTHFCAFNEHSREDIWKGFKRKINLEEAMTGREFCDLLEIDYDEIVKIRTADTAYNRRLFVTDLLKIDQMRDLIEDTLERMK